MDFAKAGDDVKAADIVIMNRVLCCYPDMPKLAEAAAGARKAGAGVELSTRDVVDASELVARQLGCCG